MCDMCRALYHWPSDKLPVPRQGERGPSPFADVPHPPSEDPEFMREIREAADRARKSRKKR
jgi:hypothetical protein